MLRGGNQLRWAQRLAAESDGLERLRASLGFISPRPTKPTPDSFISQAIFSELEPWLVALITVTIRRNDDSGRSLPWDGGSTSGAPEATTPMGACRGDEFFSSARIYRPCVEKLEGNGPLAGRLGAMCYELSVLDRIGQVVLTARKQAGRSRDDIALEAGVQAQALESLEEGKPGLTTTQLVAVARALFLDPVALLSGRKEERPVPSVFLRHAPAQDFDAEDHDVLDEALDESRELIRLRELLGRSPLCLQANFFQTREAAADAPDAPAWDGYKLARDVRRSIGQTKEPFTDLRELIEGRLGAMVVVRQLASRKVTAATVRAGVAAAIVLSAADTQRGSNPLLARVILAHELCHALFDPLVGGLQIVVDENNDRKTNAAERRARAFAAELLLPLDGLSGLLGPALSISNADAASHMVARARSHFGTPHEIAANHLCNHGFVHISLRERLEHDKTPFTGTAPITTLPRAGEPSIVVREHVEAAHRDGHLTDGEARAILGLDRLAPLPWDPPTL